MTMKEDKERIKELKVQLKSARKSYDTKAKANNWRLVKLGVVLVIVVVIAGVMYGWIPIAEYLPFLTN